MAEEQKGVIYRGNWRRLKDTMKKALAKEEICIAFFGGSITQGSLATSDEKCYAYLVYQWWVNHFPETTIRYVNGGIGGTDSYYGAARVNKDLLNHTPDLVMIDFSVNDSEDFLHQETYEGVVRKIYLEKQKPAILLLHHVFYDTGKNAEFYHSAVGKAYHLPCISMKEGIYKDICLGLLKEKEITSDHLHPNDKGHQMAADLICKFLNTVYEEVQQEESLIPCPAPITPNSFQNALLHQGNKQGEEPILKGFYRDLEPKLNMLDLYKNGWIGTKTGDSITFRIVAGCIAIQYRKTIHQPSPIAKCVIDGKEEILLDGNFSEDWGDCLYLQPILKEETAKEHTIEITIISHCKEDQMPFYLVSMITA